MGKKYRKTGKNDMNAIEAIERYLVFLITECGLSVTLHPIEKESLVTFGPLSRFTSIEARKAIESLDWLGDNGFI